MLRNHLFHSGIYTRVQARNSYTVKFLGVENNFCFGHIVVFLLFTDLIDVFAHMNVTVEILLLHVLKF